MLIVAAYPNGLEPLADGSSPIRRLTSLVDRICPPEVALHLFPFSVSSGDWGFAQDDWCGMDSALGTWSDIGEAANGRPLIVDGIYNHVGVGHQWVQRFMRRPYDGRRFLHAYRPHEVGPSPLSPRGQPVLCSREINGEKWLLWQTFTDAAIDVRLEEPEVQAEISRHLAMLRSRGIWGVRLDAVAYYGKAFAGPIRHQSGSIALASAMVRRVREYGLEALVQLDQDRDGQRYFRDLAPEAPVVNDFAYTIYLALAMLEGCADPLAAHLVRSGPDGLSSLRAPRTHDGMLLRSNALLPADRRRILALAAEHGISVRTSGGAPYELNCSAPFLLSRIARSREQLEQMIDLATAITCFASQWPYLYLPFLLGFVPEKSGAPQSNDPRALNRAQVPADHLAHLAASGRLDQLRILVELLSRVAKIRSAHRGSDLGTPDVSVIEGHGLLLRAPQGDHILLANLSAERSLSIPRTIAGDLLFARNPGSRRLEPHHFAIWLRSRQATAGRGP